MSRAGQVTSLLWKEWRETRAYLVIALGVFLGLPLIGAVQAIVTYQRRFALETTVWVVPLAGVLAVFVAAGTACRDLDPRLEGFWRSRPVGTVSWLLVKFLVGLAVVLVACMLPLAAEAIVYRRGGHDVPPPAADLGLSLPFLWAALYSLAFLAGCLVRRAAHAAMLGLAAMLLLYFLPLVLPPLRSLSVEDLAVGETAWGPLGRVARFAVRMLAIAGAALLLSVAAVRRGWRVESGRRVMYWSVGTALLLLFASMAFQVATYLPVLHAVDLPAGEWVTGVRSDGARGVLFTTPRLPGVGSPGSPNAFRPFRLTAAGIELGRSVSVGEQYPGEMTWLGEHPDVVYVVRPRFVLDTSYCELVAVSVGGESEPVIVRLWDPTSYNNFSLYGAGDRLYVGLHERDGRDRMATLDISQPLRPRVVSMEPRGRDHGPAYAAPPPPEEIVDRPTLDLTAFRDVPPEQRLAMALAIQPSGWGLRAAGGFFVRNDGRSLSVFRLAEQTATMARFERVGGYAATFVDQMFGGWGYHTFAGTRLVYLSAWYPWTGNPGVDRPRLAVFDVRDPRHPRPAGHFAVPGGEPLVVAPLPDGRALAAGRKLYLLGPPPLPD